MSTPRKSLFLTHDSVLSNIALQTHLDCLSEIDEDKDPEVYALTESAIAELKELLDADKFYDC